MGPWTLLVVCLCGVLHAQAVVSASKKEYVSRDAYSREVAKGALSQRLVKRYHGYHYSKCVHEGEEYSEYQTVQTTPCEMCTCAAGGSLLCAVIDCPPTNCLDAVTAPGDCCATCPNGPSCYLVSSSGGLRVLRGRQEVVMVYDTAGEGCTQTCSCPKRGGGGFARCRITCPPQ